MKKIAFFPYHPDLLTLLDQTSALKNYIISGFLSYEEDTKRTKCLNEMIGLTDFSYDSIMKDCDAVVLLDNYRNFKPDRYYHIIEDALQHQKQIMITPLAQSQLDMRNYEGQYTLLECLPDGLDADAEAYVSNTERKLFDINLPIIGVVGQGKHCEKFATQLLLKSALEEDYETVVVTSNALGALFGCYTMPSFIYDDRPFQDKVFLFNYFVRRLSKIGNPDVITIGIPEGIASFREKEYHHFGEYPLIVTNAVSVDMTLLCTYMMTGPSVENGLKKVIDFCERKYDFSVGAVSISRTLYEIPSEEHDAIVFSFLDDASLRKLYPDITKISLPIINIFKHEDAIIAIKKSLCQLQNNIRVI